MAKRGFIFNSVKAPKLQRSAFDLSHEHKLACGMGTLVPIECIECVPGDTFKITPSMVLRLQALISPMMQRVDASIQWFKVPYRLIWDDFEDFMTGGKDGTSNPAPPTVRYGELADYLTVGSLGDHFGLPLPFVLNAEGKWERAQVEEPISDELISLLPFRAYAKIYNDYYRDQNVTDEVEFDKGSGTYDIADVTAIMPLRRRAWRKDYFTSALPDPQRGDEVTIGLGGNAPVYGTGAHSAEFGNLKFQDTSSSRTNVSGSVSVDGFRQLLDSESLNTFDSGEMDLDFGDSTPFANADLSEVSVIGITALRVAFKMQQFLERNNIAGARYIEQILAHFGVKSSDARLQRAEYLGGGSVPIITTEVETNANAQGEYDNVVGDLAGKAKAVGGLGTVTTFCEEHCFIIGLLSIMPKASYSQGLSRMWTRQDKFDFFWPEFQHIGEQNIKNKEVYFGPNSVNPDGDFGYQARYSEYKYSPDRVSGDLRTSLDFWHLGRQFNSEPGLNESFIECNPSDRIFAVSDLVSTQHCVCDIWFNEKAVRPMSVYSTPKIC